MMSRSIILLFAAISYLSFLAVSVWMVAFLLGHGRLSPDEVEIGWIAAVSIDIALVSLFGVAHSVMARSWFKAKWTKIVPPAAERAFYTFQSSLLLALIFWQWQPIPIIIWELQGLAAGIVLVFFGIGLVVIVLATFLLDHFMFTGLRQAWHNFRGIPMPVARFRTPLLYQWVRHPLQSGILITLFAVPTMTLDGLLFALTMAGYINVGLKFEERGLVREFGAQYREYRTNVPMLFPRFPGLFPLRIRDRLDGDS